MKTLKQTEAQLVIIREQKARLQVLKDKLSLISQKDNEAPF